MLQTEPYSQSIIMDMVETSTESAHAIEDRSLPICWGISDTDVLASRDEDDSSVHFVGVDFALRVGFRLWGNVLPRFLPSIT
jgi:hypothetical protein